MLGWHFEWKEWFRYARHWDGCAFCDGPQEVIASVVPWRRGGARTIGNAVPSCRGCRAEKSTRVITIWRAAQTSNAAATLSSLADQAKALGFEDHLIRHREKLAARWAPRAGAEQAKAPALPWRDLKKQMTTYELNQIAAVVELWDAQRATRDRRRANGV